MADELSRFAAHSPSARCLGWLCDWRDHCRRHVVNSDFVLKQWFLPQYHGEHCEWYEHQTPKGRDAE